MRWQREDKEIKQVFFHWMVKKLCLVGLDKFLDPIMKIDASSETFMSQIIQSASFLLC